MSAGSGPTGAVPDGADVLRALPGPVRAELARRGVELSAAGALLDLAPGDAVLLAGSYATGEANPTSDLDLLVLTPAARPVRRRPGRTNHPSTFGDSIDGRVAGLVVNVEYVAVDRLAAVAALLDRLRADPAPDLPNLQALELRLVHRLATGVPLAGADRLAALRAGADVDAARAAAAALYFVMALSFLEDVQVMRPPAVELMVRSAGEALLLAAVNAYGRITYDVKHVCSRAAALAAAGAGPAVLDRYEAVLLVDRLPPAAGTALLLDLAVDLHARLRARDLLPALLAPYRPGWAWTGRAFG